MRSLPRFVRLAVALGCVALATPFLAAEGLYRFGLHLLGDPPAVRGGAPDLVVAAAWLEAGERVPARVESRSPSGFVIRMVLERQLLESDGYRAAARGVRRWVAGHPELRSWRRPLAHWAATVWATRHWTAAELTQAWLDGACFGRGAYGLEAASKAYVGKPSFELRPDELALLLAISRAPSRFDPDRRPEAAKAAREAVLRRLLVSGLIGQAEYTRAVERPLPTVP